MKDKKIIVFVVSFLMTSVLGAQTLPKAQRADWSNAGIQGGIPCLSVMYDVSQTNPALLGDSMTNNANSLKALLADTLNYPSPCVFYFPEGVYIFEEEINMREGLVIRGDGVDKTHFVFNTSGDCFSVGDFGGEGNYIKVQLIKGDSSLYINQSSLDSLALSVEDYVAIYQENNFGTVPPPYDTIWWAKDAVGQIAKVKAAEPFLSVAKLQLDRPARIDFKWDSGYVRIKKIEMIRKVGFENFKITMLRDSTLNQDSTVGNNFYFKHAADCWIAGVESDHTRNSHVNMWRSSNIHITGNYFHHAYFYGAGGSAYGVNCTAWTGDVLVENNVFKHLRHAMIISMGANGNVYAYNYSIENTNEKGWEPPDISNHGFYAYMNLFEGNIVQSIVTSDAWGPGGPGNTFLRNRIEGTTNVENKFKTHYQNFIGNELTGGNTKIVLAPEGGLVGEVVGSIRHGNNENGTITYDSLNYGDTVALSYYLKAKPIFFDILNWPDIGPEYYLGSGTIPAKERWEQGNPTVYFDCDSSTSVLSSQGFSGQVKVFPNPSNGIFEIFGKPNIKHQTSSIDYRLSIINTLGQSVYRFQLTSSSTTLDLSHLEKGIYFIRIEGYAETKKIILR